MQYLLEDRNRYTASSRTRKYFQSLEYRSNYQHSGAGRTSISKDLDLATLERKIFTIRLSEFFRTNSKFSWPLMVLLSTTKSIDLSCSDANAAVFFRCSDADRVRFAQSQRPRFARGGKGMNRFNHDMHHAHL